MRREFIHAVPHWRQGHSRYDCVFVETENDPVAVGRVCKFLQFSYKDKKYPCALIHWFTKSESEPIASNGMWVIEPMLDPDGMPVALIVSINAIIRATHLLPVFRDGYFAPEDLECHETLDYFDLFYHHSSLVAS